MRCLSFIAAVAAAIVFPSAGWGQQRLLHAHASFDSYPGDTYIPSRLRSHAVTTTFIEGEPIRFRLELGSADGELERTVRFASTDPSKVLSLELCRDGAPPDPCSDGRGRPARLDVSPLTRYHDGYGETHIEIRPEFIFARHAFMTWSAELRDLVPGVYVARITFGATDERGISPGQGVVSFEVLRRFPVLEPEIARRAATVAFMERRFDEARTEVSRLLRLAPRSAAAHQLLGLIANGESEDLAGDARSRKTLEARDHFKMAIEIVRSGSDDLLPAGPDAAAEIGEYLDGLSFLLRRAELTQLNAVGIRPAP